MGAERTLADMSAQAKNGLNRAKTALKGKGFGIGGAIFDLGTNVYFNMTGNGDNFGTALAKGVPESIAWAVAPGIMTAYMATQLAPLAVTGYMAADQRLKSQYGQNHKAGTMFNYVDTRAAITMRQAAVQAIQGSKMNARNALGGEASLMHRSWNDRM